MIAPSATARASSSVSIGTDLKPLQCMEIWGGNAEIHNGVSLAGLDCWVYSRPYVADALAKREGGDIHYVTSCATGRITRLVVADVSGHGAPVAEMAVSLRRLMRKHSNHYDQRLFVEAVNKRFSELSDPEVNPHASVFATAVFASYYAPTDEFSLCNAGHPRPLRYDAKLRVWSPMILHPSEEYDRLPANLPLGVLDDSRYDVLISTLGPRDLVLIYTDSLVEARSPDGRLIGEAGLIDLLNSLDVSKPAGLIDGLIAGVTAYSRGGPVAAAVGSGVADPAHEFDDDVTLLLLQRNDLKPSVSPVLGLKGACNIVKGIVESLCGKGLPVSLPELGVRSTLGSVIKHFNRPFTKT